MKLFFVIITTLASLFAMAAETAAPNNYQTMDLKQFDGLKDQSKVKVSMSLKCKSDSGLEYKAGDMGYEQCMKNSTKNSDAKDDKKSQNNGTMEVTF